MTTEQPSASVGSIDSCIQGLSEKWTAKQVVDLQEFLKRRTPKSAQMVEAASTI